MPFQIDGHLGDKKALSRGERRFLVVFCLLLFGGFAVEILHDFEPAKLSFVFFVLAWFALTGIHEAGHAVAARLCGWRVQRVGIGFGRPIKRFEVGGAPVEVCLFPIGGFVSIVPGSLRRARLANAVVFAAGPGAELAVALALGLALGFDTLLTPAQGSVAVLAAQSAALAAVVGAGLNLVPFAGPGGQPSDGLGVLMSPFLSQRHFLARMAGDEIDAARARLDRGDAAGALEAFEAALERHPEVTALHVGRALALAALDRRLEALVSLQARLREEGLEPGERAAIDAALALLRRSA